MMLSEGSYRLEENGVLWTKRIDSGVLRRRRTAAVPRCEVLDGAPSASFEVLWRVMEEVHCSNSFLVWACPRRTCRASALFAQLQATICN